MEQKTKTEVRQENYSLPPQAMSYDEILAAATELALCMDKVYPPLDNKVGVENSKRIHELSGGLFGAMRNYDTNKV